MDKPAADHLATIDWRRGAWAGLEKQVLAAALVGAGRGKVKGECSRAHLAPHRLGMDVEVERNIDRAYGVLTAF
jgi:hypothetical protein